MMEAGESPKLSEQFKVMWIIWGAMIASLLIYVLLCHFLGEEIRSNMKTGLDIKLLRNILFVVVACELGFIYYIRKIMLTVRGAGSEYTPVQQESLVELSSYSGKYLTAMIVSLALADSIGICGLVLFLLGDSFQTLYIFIGISGATMFYYRPKMEEFEGLHSSTEVK